MRAISASRCVSSPLRPITPTLTSSSTKRISVSRVSASSSRVYVLSSRTLERPPAESPAVNAPPPSMRFLMTLSGRYSLSCSVRMYLRSSISWDEKSLYPPRVRLRLIKRLRSRYRILLTERLGNSGLRRSTTSPMVKLSFVWLYLSALASYPLARPSVASPALWSMLPSFSTLCLPSSLCVVLPGSLGEHEPEAVLPDLYLVPVSKVDGVDPDAVDVGPVQAADVAYPVAAVPVYDLGVFPGDGDIVQKDAPPLPAAHRDALAAQVVLPAPRRALDLVHLDEGGPVGAGRYRLLAEARGVGDRALAELQLGAALGAELHLGTHLGPALGTGPHPPSSGKSPSNTLARSSGASAATPRPTSSARMRSILPCRMR